MYIKISSVFYNRACIYKIFLKIIFRYFNIFCCLFTFNFKKYLLKTIRFLFFFVIATNLLALQFSEMLYAFEAFPQPKGMLFLNPYFSFSWHNNPLGGGRYNSDDKIRQTYYGIFLEYGLTNNITLGTDTYLSQTWTSKDGKIGGKIDDKSFALEQTLIFGRYSLVNGEHFSLSFYMSFFLPSFGRGEGRLDNFKPYNKWSNEWRIETGWRINNKNAITINIGYKANYNQTRDAATFKFTYNHKFDDNWMMMIWLKKNAYINKGNKLYAFAQNNHFNLDAFNFINNSGYVAIDFFIARKVGKGKFIVLAYTHSLHSSIFGNKGMSYNYRSFWLEFWWFIRT